MFEKIDNNISLINLKLFIPKFYPHNTCAKGCKSRYSYINYINCSTSYLLVCMLTHNNKLISYICTHILHCDSKLPKVLGRTK